MVPRYATLQTLLAMTGMSTSLRTSDMLFDWSETRPQPMARAACPSKEFVPLARDMGCIIPKIGLNY